MTAPDGSPPRPDAGARSDDLGADHACDGTADGPGTGPDHAEAPLTPEEFETEVQHVANPLFGAALRLTRSRAEAEDLVQDTLFRAFRGRNGFRRGTHFKAWVFRILHNTNINRARHESMAPKAVDPADLTVADTAHPVPDLTSLADLERLADAHFDERVKEAVDVLPEIFRVPFVLFALGDLSYQEIADQLGIPIGTVMSRLHRARRLLKARLADYVAGTRLSEGARDG